MNETEILGHNQTSFDKLKPMFEDEMTMSYEEQVNTQFHWLYELGIEQGAQVMIAFPLLQMCICLGLAFEITVIGYLIRYPYLDLHPNRMAKKPISKLWRQRKLIEPLDREFYIHLHLRYLEHVH